MMKTTLRLLTIMTVTLLIASCGGGGSKKKTEVKSSFDLKPTETTIKGYMSGVLEVVEGEYKFEYGSNYKGLIQVKIKSVGKGDPNDYGLNDGNGGPLYLTVCDNSGKPITGYDDIRSSFNADGLLKDMVTKVGEENWILFEESLLGKDYLPDDACKFYIVSKKIEEKGKSSASASDSDKGSKEWDKLLDDYESYVDQYIKTVKKAANGDLSAMLEYDKLYDKAEKFGSSLDDALDNNKLSTAQATRLTKILAKLAKGMEEADRLEDMDDDDDDW